MSFIAEYRRDIHDHIPSKLVTADMADLMDFAANRRVGNLFSVFDIDVRTVRRFPQRIPTPRPIQLLLELAL